MPLSDLDMLSAVIETAGGLGIELLLIGAIARELMIEKCLQTEPCRATRDLDLIAQVQSWAQFDEFLHEIAAVTSLKRWGDHKLVDFAGTEIDILPIGHIRDDSGELAWPKSGVVMSVDGLKAAMETGVSVDLGMVRIRTATVASMVSLKLFAYRDRHTQTRKDLDDLIQILTHATHVLLERVYEELGDEVAEIEFDDLGPTLLGRDIRALLPASEREKAIHILDTMLLTPPSYVALSVAAGRRDPSGVIARFQALRRGLG
jgi:predicted nucleotidyltransferase